MKALLTNRISLMMVVSGLLISFTACQEDNSLDSRFAGFQSDEFMVSDATTELGYSITDATLEQDAIINMPQMFDAKSFKRKAKLRKGLGFRMALSQLDLDEAQSETVHESMRTYRKCVHGVRSTLRETIKAMLGDVREQRMAVIQAMKDGEITREEAKAQLRTLSTQTRDTIKNSSEFEASREVIKQCKENLIDNISSVLNDDQLVKWNEWLENND